MEKIVFGAVGVEGLGNISIDEEFGRGRLENGVLDHDKVVQIAGSHGTFPVSENCCLKSCLVGRREDATTIFGIGHI
jgi:hypothetical protein